MRSLNTRLRFVKTAQVSPVELPVLFTKRSTAGFPKPFCSFHAGKQHQFPMHQENCAPREQPCGHRCLPSKTDPLPSCYVMDTQPLTSSCYRKLRMYPRHISVEGVYHCFPGVWTHFRPLLFWFSNSAPSPTGHTIAYAEQMLSFWLLLRRGGL